MASQRTTRQINRFLDEAEEVMNNSDWSRVRDRAQNVLRLDPSNSDANFSSWR